MKNLSAISKKGIIFLSATIMITAWVLVLGLPANSDGCSGSSGCRSHSSNVDIPLVNNHYPKVAKISKIYIEVSGECHHCKHDDDIRVKVISLGGTAYYDRSPDLDSHCCCRNRCHGYAYTLDTPYEFSTAKATCTVTLDVATAPTGEAYPYTIKCFYEVPSGAGNGAWGKELTYIKP